jgi:hypothetical protein
MDAETRRCVRCGADDKETPLSSVDNGRTWRCYYRDECQVRFPIPRPVPPHMPWTTT